MTNIPTVVGINRTQDASIAIARGADCVQSIQKERITRRKHHWGRPGDVRGRYLPRMPLLREPIDLVVESYSSDAEIENIEAYRAELRESLSLKPDARMELVSHHLAHIYSAFFPSPFDVAAGLIVDAQGSRVRDFTEPVPLSGASLELLEVGSFYRCERDGAKIECLAKQLWDGDWSHPVGLGCFYYLLTRMLWPSGEGNEGKVMGLAPFGDPDAHRLPDLEVRGHEVFIPDAWMEAFAERDRYCYFVDGTGTFHTRCSNSSSGCTGRPSCQTWCSRAAPRSIAQRTV